MRTQARIHLNGMPRTPDFRRDVEVLRTVGDVVTVVSEYTSSGEADYSVASGRRLESTGDPCSWDFWRFETEAMP